MNPDIHESPEVRENEPVKVPRRLNRQLQDILHPIVLRRTMLWRVGMGVAVLLVAAVVAWALLLKPPSGRTLLAQAVEAAGGMEPWKAIEHGTFTRVHTVYDESGAVVRTVNEKYAFRKGGKGDRLVIESSGAKGHALIGRDDKGYWATLNGETAEPEETARELDMMCESDECTPICGAELAFYRFSMPFKLTDPGVIAAYGGKSMLAGQPVSLLNVSFEKGVGGDRWTLYVDDETKLVRKIDYYANATMTDMTPPQEIFWGDHRAQDGVTISHRQTYYRSNGSKLEDYRIVNADFSTPIPDAVFNRPTTTVAVAQ